MEGRPVEGVCACECGRNGGSMDAAREGGIQKTIGKMYMYCKQMLLTDRPKLCTAPLHNTFLIFVPRLLSAWLVHWPRPFYQTHGNCLQQLMLHHPHPAAGEYLTSSITHSQLLGCTAKKCAGSLDCTHKDPLSSQYCVDMYITVMGQYAMLEMVTSAVWCRACVLVCPW